MQVLSSGLLLRAERLRGVLVRRAAPSSLTRGHGRRCHRRPGLASCLHPARPGHHREEGAHPASSRAKGADREGLPLRGGRVLAARGPPLAEEPEPLVSPPVLERGELREMRRLQQDVLGTGRALGVSLEQASLTS